MVPNTDIRLLQEEKNRSLGESSSEEGAGGQVVSAEEGADIHSLFAGDLHFGQAEGAVECGYAESLAAVAGYGAGGLHRCIGYGGGCVDLEVLLCAVGCAEDGPGCGVWGETPDEVVYAGGGLIPVYAAGLLKDLGGRTEFIGRNIRLRYGSYISGQDIIKGPDGKVCTQLHELVMESANVIGRQYRYAFLMDYIAGIYLVFEEEGGYARLLIAVDYGPVYGSGSSILRQK